MHMRTTITISEDLLKKTVKTSGKKFVSEAIVSSLTEYHALRERMNFLEKLFQHKLPHSFSQIKRQRKKRQWYS